MRDIYIFHPLEYLMGIRIMKISKEKLSDCFLLSPLFFFYAAMIGVPIMLIFLSSLGLISLTAKIPKGFTLEGYRKFFLSSGSPYLVSLLFTFRVTLISTIIATALGYLLALFLKLRKPSLSKLCISLIRIPLFCPFLISSFMWWTLLYPKGYISIIFEKIFIDFLHIIQTGIPLTNGPYGIGIIMCASWMKFPIAFSIMYGLFHMVDPELEAAARNLGARTWQVIRYIYFPLTIYGVLSSAVAIFLSVFIAFSIAFVHGGSWPRFLSILIYRDTMERGEWLMGYTASIVYITISLIISYIYLQIINLQEKKGQLK